MANTLKVKLEGTDVLTHSMLNGIDFANCLANTTVPNSAEQTINITQDCWLLLSYTSYSTIKIDGVEPRYNNQYFVKNYTIFPLKKDQVLKLTGAGGSSGLGYKLFGIKR